MNRQQRVAHLAALVVIGVCAPAAPSLAQDCPELVGRWPYGRANAVAVAGSYAYYGSGTALMIADISNPANPRLVGDVALPGSVRDIAISDGYAYVGHFFGVSVFDVQTPSSPREVGFFESPDVSGVAVSGGYAYVAGGGFRLVAVNNPSAPVEVWADPGAGASAVAVSGDYAYLANQLSPIHVPRPRQPLPFGPAVRTLYPFA